MAEPSWPESVELAHYLSDERKAQLKLTIPAPAIVLAADLVSRIPRRVAVRGASELVAALLVPYRSMTDEPREGRAPEEDFRTYTGLAEKHGWPAWAAVFLTAFANIPNASRGAETAGVAASTVYRLAQRSDSFNDVMEEARNIALDRLESTAYLRSTVGTPVTKTITKTKVYRDGTQETTTITSEERHVSDILLMFYLKRYRPEFRERFGVEQTGADGGPIHIEVDERVNEAAQQLRAEVIRLADRRRTDDASANGSG